MDRRTVLQPAAERAGIGRVTWHQFRHIHSSLLNDLRVLVKIAQQQHRQAVEAVEERLFTELDPNGPKLAIVPREAPLVNARSA